MVNINIPIDDDLHKQLKLAALMDDKTLKDYIITAIDEATKEVKHG